MNNEDFKAFNQTPAGIKQKFSQSLIEDPIVEEDVW